MSEPGELENMTTSKSRRSDRITVALPVEVVGSDLEGQSFFDNTQTVMISKHGAAIKLERKLSPDQHLTLLVKKQVEVRVLGKLRERADGCVYAVAFEKPSENSVWDIEFPTAPEQEEAVVQTSLECCSCRTREVCCLNFLEAEVLQAGKGLTRVCKRCRDSTVWKGALNEGLLPDPPEELAGELDVQPAPAQAESLKTPNRRKHNRARIKMTACVRCSRLQQEAVSCGDVSRGGLSFLSNQRYLLGEPIEVAMPYKPGAANIFVPARIVYALDLSAGGRMRYGVRYQE